ncbi:MAG: hypothetical protein AVDCRST_MAG76-3854, partial [uncultured Acidimicrobiales bacterium]
APLRAIPRRPLLGDGRGVLRSHRPALRRHRPRRAGRSRGPFPRQRRAPRAALGWPCRGGGAVSGLAGRRHPRARRGARLLRLPDDRGRAGHHRRPRRPRARGSRQRDPAPRAHHRQGQERPARHPPHHRGEPLAHLGPLGRRWPSGRRRPTRRARAADPGGRRRGDRPRALAPSRSRTGGRGGGRRGRSTGPDRRRPPPLRGRQRLQSRTGGRPRCRRHPRLPRRAGRGRAGRPPDPPPPQRPAGRALAAGRPHPMVPDHPGRGRRRRADANGHGRGGSARPRPAGWAVAGPPPGHHDRRSRRRPRLFPTRRGPGRPRRAWQRSDRALPARDGHRGRRGAQGRGRRGRAPPAGHGRPDSGHRRRRGPHAAQDHVLLAQAQDGPGLAGPDLRDRHRVVEV